MGPFSDLGRRGAVLAAPNHDWSEELRSIADSVPGREDVRLVTRLREQVVAGFVDESPELHHFDADETAPEFLDLTADDHGIDVPDVGR
jgi:hypothetical protein